MALEAILTLNMPHLHVKLDPFDAHLLLLWTKTIFHCCLFSDVVAISNHECSISTNCKLHLTAIPGLGNRCFNENVRAITCTNNLRGFSIFLNSNKFFNFFLKKTLQSHLYLEVFRSFPKDSFSERFLKYSRKVSSTESLSKKL